MQKMGIRTGEGEREGGEVHPLNNQGVGFLGPIFQSLLLRIIW